MITLAVGYQSLKSGIKLSTFRLESYIFSTRNLRSIKFTQVINILDMVLAFIPNLWPRSIAGKPNLRRTITKKKPKTKKNKTLLSMEALSLGQAFD